MHIIIAGGSGFIGKALTLAYSKLGDQIVILSRNPKKVTGLPAGVKVLQWDGETMQDWAKEINNTNVVMNLTGENLSGEGFLPARWTKIRKERLISSRVNSGRILSQAIAKADRKPEVFIQSSGISYYGTDADTRFTEESPGGNDFLADLCKVWEASSESVEAMGVRRVILRNGIVLGNKSGALPRLLLPYKLFVGGPMGNGHQIYSWIHMVDEINAIRFLIVREQAHGVFNLTSPIPVTNSEFGKTISKVLKRPHYFPLPGFILKLAFGEVATVVLEGQRVIPGKLLSLGYEFRYPTLEDALIEIVNEEHRN